MRKLTAFSALAALLLATGSPAFAAAPDVYVVNFKNEKSAESKRLDQQLQSALSMVDRKIEHVVFDTTTAARWEKGAHEAFDRDIVPVFNKWVGLPGFAAIVDARSKNVLGCINGNFGPAEMAKHISTMAAQVSGDAYISNTSFSRTTQCPPTFNEPPK